MAIATHNRRRAVLGVLPHPDNDFSGGDLGHLWRYLWPAYVPPVVVNQYPYLQFSAASGGPYAPASFQGVKAGYYRVDEIGQENRSGEAESVLYRVQAGVVTLLLNPVLLSAPAWYFRLQIPRRSIYYPLGLQYYQVSYDALLAENFITKTKIDIEFQTNAPPEAV